MPRRTSQADETVIAAAAAAGVTLTARQLERWRQAGWIEHPERHYPGRGQGSTSAYAGEAIAQAIALGEAVRRRYPLYKAVLDLFAACKPVSEAALRRAFREFLSSIESGLRDLAGESAGGDVFDVAEGAALNLVGHAERQKFVRRWRRRAKGSPESASSVVQSALTNLFQLLLIGRATSPEATDELLVVSGVAATWTDRSGHLGPLAPEGRPAQLNDVFGALRIASLAATADQATMPALLQARGDWEVTWELGQAAGYVLGQTTGLPDAFGFGVARGVERSAALTAIGTLGMLVLGRSLGNELQNHLDVCRRDLPRCQAMAVILSDMPADARPFMAEGGLARLAVEDESRQLHVVSAIRAATGRHPREAALLTS
jgi:hypothetical protein